MDSFFLLLLGAVLVIPIWQMIDLARYRWRGRRVMGQVIKLDKQDDSDGSPTYAPVIEYRVGEEKWRIKPEGYVYPALYHVGQEVPIYYFPDNPRMGRLVTPREFVKWSIGAIIVGCLLIPLLCRGFQASP